jgi:hypothetical protein
LIMPDPITALTVGGGLIGSQMTSSATRSAADTQAGAAQAGIDEQRRQNEAVQQLLAPYVQAGGGALGAYAPYQQAGAGALPTLQQYAQAGAPALEQQQALLGLRGPEAERAAIQRISGGEQFKALTEQGEGALLSRASATGGLRGGNVQAALAQFRPAMLNAEIERQYGRLGGLTQLGAQTELNVAQLGQAGAARQAAAGLQTAANIGSLGGQMATNIGSFGGQMAANIGNFGAQAATNIGNLGAQAGAAQAGGILGQAGAYGNFLSGAIPQAAGTAFLLNKYNLFGGAQSPTQTGMMIGRSGMEATSPELANNLMFGTPTGFR